MLPPGRSQARAGDYPSVQGISGVASTERLAASLGCSFDGSLRDTPATVANIAVGSEVEEHQEKPRVPPPQGATATSTDRGAQADQEEFREALPKEAEKATSKSEPRLDPEPLPTAVSDDSDEMRTQSRRDGEDADPHDAALRSRLMMRDSPTPVIVDEPQEQISCLSAPNPQVFVTPLNHSELERAFILPNAINSVNPLDTTLPDISPRGDTRNGRISDGEHAGGCIVFGFKLPWPRQLRCGGN